METGMNYWAWLMTTDEGRERWAAGLDAMGLHAAAETVRAMVAEQEAARA